MKTAVVRIISVRPPKPPEEESTSQVAKASDSDRTATTAIGSGFIATNKHVIENSIAVYVATSDGVRYKATVLARRRRRTLRC